MDIIQKVEIDVKKLSEEYKKNSKDNYDFWNEHIKYVYEESQKLAKKYDADMEIVKLGALLHDIALICQVGDRKDHHKNGKFLAEEILKKYNYQSEKIEKVANCVYNHRSSKNTTNKEEQCVADADILAHFDNIPMLFNSAYTRNGIKLSDVREWLKERFEKDFLDLSEDTQKEFKNRYNEICDIVLGKNYL